MPVVIISLCIYQGLDDLTIELPTDVYAGQIVITEFNLKYLVNGQSTLSTYFTSRL